MSDHRKSLSRRRFLARSASLAGAGLVLPASMGRAFAQSYPSRNINVVIPTAQGGGIEQHARNLAGLWGPALGVNFEYEFHPGAAGQVGYEVYANRKQEDGYNLLAGNMGAEIVMYATQDPSFEIPGDITYFACQAGDPSVIYVGAESPIQTIEDLVEQSLGRTLTVSTSRLPHPATLGALLLADVTGGNFNMVPFAGGNATAMAAITGEVAAAVSPVGLPVSLGDQVRILAILGDRGNMGELMPGVPTVKEAFDADLPNLISAVGWAIHTSVWEGDEEVRRRIEETFPPVFEDERLEEAYGRSGLPFEGVQYRDAAWCQEYFDSMIEVTERYRDVLTGS